MDMYATRDQALLALVIDEAGKLCESGSAYLGRTAVQKILYFLQVYGVPMRYRFDVHHYGPFCPQILSDVDSLSLLGAIADRSSDSSKYSNYRISSEGKALVEEFGDDIEDFRNDVRDVASALVPLQPDRLELLATMHYAFRELRATLPSNPTKAAVIGRFFEYKGDKFDKKEVEIAYDSLLEARLIQSSGTKRRKRG